MEFKRNKKWRAELRKHSDAKYGQSRWISDEPLFVNGNKGLYPVFKTGGPTGTFPKNHQELILKTIGDKNGEKDSRANKRVRKEISNGRPRTTTKIEDIL